ncbi:translation initiation factor IF-2 [Leptolyngbya sp. FACHB-36]|uniref:translation initiation factor IF-2 n=1 Tax=Leptolyngbya sp. FACHB-36 TaxID=2692808 RepID=UPI001681803A|nr:translation initiation factor IF-2 [Leptolyngbya sp. FACHB-36]MBD2019617.1 translation initiation factor IF-2 [Leptolyngbya sp. FACHB-36]
MNNGKVRIYELSRELNLDNKDLLAVCEQLNISVKSHSSTITDSEAEKIRAAAEKQSGQSSVKSAQVRQQGPQAQAADAKPRVPAPVQKKQQILEIRKPIIRQNASSESSTASSDSVSPPAAPPSIQAPSKPASLNRPAAIKPEAPTEAVKLPEVPPEIPEDTSPPVEAETQPPAELQELTLETVSEKAPEPELTRPPARPIAEAVTPKPALTTRPLIKRSQQESAPSEAKPAPERAARRDGAPRPPAPGSVNRQPGAKPPEDRPTPRPQIMELRRPRPVRPDSEEAVPAPVGRTEGGVPGVIKINRPKPGDPAGTAPGAPETVQLQERPSLPRTLKKGKTRQEEEEEARDFSEKVAAKAAAKTKRRTQPNLDDEDEDLDNLLGAEGLDGDSPAQVSLSLMRPAKPKQSRPPQVKAPVATVTPKSKKSTSFRDRRDRREQEVKVERPEKITLMGGLTVQELSGLLTVPDTEIIKTLFMKGILATVTQTLDVPTATMVAQEFGIEVETGEREAEARKVTEMLDAEDLEHLIRRPPVVTIMGHVDHGKTTLLDSIRKTKVAQGEAGGITQHIGAYHVDVEHNDQMQQVVFLDTPGHEAFTAMRARGARVTDIAILVVAADDGVRPQTVEAISHAKAAEVPIIVAINKIDKEEAQPDRVKQELTEYALVPEEWGGDTIMVPVSAINGENLDTLLEMILLVSEIEELSANPDRPAKGTVIEANLDKAKGPVATLLIQNGTLRVGDTLVAGSALGKVRAMVDDRGDRVKVASPSFAVEVLGLGDVPAAGDEFEVFPDEKEARAVASTRTDEQRQSRLLQAMSSRRVSLNTLSARAQEGDLKELNLVLKADVQGSVEAILGSLKQLPQNEVQVRVLFAAPGEITETDVDLAAASDAVIIGFNTTLATGARQAADQAGVDVREYTIIYKLLDDIQGAMEGLLEPELVEEALGQAEVRAVFPVGRGSVAGCYILSGKVIRNSKVRVRRGSNVIHESNLDSLKRMREDAREVNAGYECGIGVDNFNAWETGDIIEVYRMITKRRTLSPAK